MKERIRMPFYETLCTLIRFTSTLTQKTAVGLSRNAQGLWHIRVYPVVFLTLFSITGD